MERIIHHVEIIMLHPVCGFLKTLRETIWCAFLKTVELNSTFYRLCLKWCTLT